MFGIQFFLSVVALTNFFVPLFDSFQLPFYMERHSYLNLNVGDDLCALLG
jgi:hypothetical protein